MSSASVGDWRRVTFGEAADLLPGKYLPASAYAADGPYVVYGSNSVMGRAARPLHPGPIVVLAKIGSNCGATRYSDEPCWINNNAAGVRARSDADTRFLYYWMQTFDFARIREGSGQPYISSGTLKAQELMLPPLPEQRRIAALLGAIDDKVELNRAMSQTLEVMARSLFRSWFVDFDPVVATQKGMDPGLSQPLASMVPRGFQYMDGVQLPVGWETRGLDAIARFQNGLALQRYPVRDGRSLPVIKIAQLRSGGTRGADLASADLDTDYIVNDGDVIFSWSGTLECVVWSGGPGALNQHLFKVTSAAYPKWLYYLWVHEHLENFRRIAAGKATTMGHIQRHHLTEAKVILPPQPLLSELDRVIAPIIDSMWTIRVESRELSELRDALLPKLISGELRLADAERIAKEAGA